MKKILQLKLKILAKLILAKYKPKIVGITGSVGKTSARDAIFHVLQTKFNVRTSYKNYNNEIGLPLTIIGHESPGRSLRGWSSVFLKALRLIIVTDKKYPKILVLEMGIDRPDDMKYLLSIAPVDVGIVTGVSHSHLEYFGSVMNIRKEKQVLIEKINNKGLAILNYDNELSRDMAKVSTARVVTFGLQEGANICAQDIRYYYSSGDYEIMGVNFKLNNDGSVVPVTMTNILSETALYAALVSTAVGSYFGMNLVEIAQALKDFSLPPGRMNFINGIKNTFIIDDTYNSSPESAVAAVKTLGKVKLDKEAKKYAVLGDILEIGHYTEEGHALVGQAVVKANIDYLIAVGEKARDIVRGAIKEGMSKDNIFHFDRSEEAGKFLEDRIEAGDIILVKGSQGVRMEKIVKEIMAEPEKSSELLVRQGKNWEDK